MSVISQLMKKLQSIYQSMDEKWYFRMSSSGIFLPRLLNYFLLFDDLAFTFKTILGSIGAKSVNKRSSNKHTIQSTYCNLGTIVQSVQYSRAMSVTCPFQKTKLIVIIIQMNSFDQIKKLIITRDSSTSEVSSDSHCVKI